MGGDFSAVTVIGAALVVAVGLFAIRGERWNRRRVQPTEPAAEPAKPERTTCANARAQQEYRKQEEL